MADIGSHVGALVEGAHVEGGGVGASTPEGRARRAGGGGVGAINRVAGAYGLPGGHVDAGVLAGVAGMNTETFVNGKDGQLRGT